MLCKTLIFFTLGPLQLLIRNFSDTFCFMRNCWSEGHVEKEQASSIIDKKSPLISKDEILEVIYLASETTLRKNPQSPEE